MEKTNQWIWQAVLAAALFFSCSTAWADELTATSGNSSITVDPESSDGLKAWKVDGVNHLYKEWFWWRLDDSDLERPLDALSLEHAELHGPDTIHLTYEEDLVVDVLYSLGGGAGGSGESELEEWITVTNDSGDEVDLRFFVYTDFDLMEYASGDNAFFTPAAGSSPASITQTKEGTTAVVESVTPITHWQIGPFPSILTSLADDADPTTLSDTESPFGPEDVEHAFQYNVDHLEDGQSSELHTWPKQSAHTTTAGP